MIIGKSGESVAKKPVPRNIVVSAKCPEKQKSGWDKFVDCLIGAVVVFAAVMTALGVQAASGYSGYRLDGSKLSKSEAQARINNSQTNMSLAFSGASMGQNAMNANGKPSNNKTNQGSDNLNPKNPMTGEDWNKYFKETYGVGNVQWKPTSYQDIIVNPQRLYGCTKNELKSILGSGWTEGTYGSAGGGWKFTNGDKSVFYHPGGGRHGGSYYGFSNSADGKVKLVDDQYIYIYT